MDDSFAKSEDKSTRSTMAITMLLMGFLTVAGLVLKRHAEDRPAPAPGAAAAGGPAKSSGFPVPAPAIPLGDDGQPRSDYQVLTDCRLEDDPLTDGDTFRISSPSGTHLFQLAWVRTVEMNGGTPEAAREAMDHFGLKSEQNLHELALEARDFTVNTLGAVHFRVVTNWEKDPGSGAYLCFLYASDGAAEAPKLRDLGLMLVQNGLALIVPSTLVPPEAGVSAGDYHNQLVAVETEAKRTRSGGWAR